jgi:type IV pilus assembly protein PilM
MKISLPKLISLPKIGKLLATPSNIPFGLDISDLYLRLVQLKDVAGKNLTLQTFNELPVPPGIVKEGEILDTPKLSQLIKKLIEQAPGGITCKEVIIDLPEPKTFIKMVTFNWPEDEYEVEEESKKNQNKGEKRDKLSNKKRILYKILANELAEDVPLSLEEAGIDYQFIKGNLEGAKPGEELKLIVAVAPKKIIDDYTQVLEESGLIPVALEIEGMSIARALIKHDSSKVETLKIIIDLGATRTGLIIYYNDLVRYSLSIPVSGRQTTQMIADQEKVPFNEAEKLKISHQLNPQLKDNISQIIESELENVISRIKEVMIFCELKISAQKKPEIVLCGGGANWPGLDEILSKRLETPVTIASPWINFNEKPKDFPLDKTLSFATAIGLALGGLYDYA